MLSFDDLKQYIEQIRDFLKMPFDEEKQVVEAYIRTALHLQGENYNKIDEATVLSLEKDIAFLTVVVANRLKGNYKIEDMTEDQNYDEDKIYWSCFSETPSGRECILVYAFDKEEFGDECPDERYFDNVEYAFQTYPASEWK